MNARAPLSAAFRSAGGLLALLLGAALACAQGPDHLVNDVIPQGNVRITSQQIIGWVHTRPGTVYSQDTINEDVKRLVATRNFADVQVAVQPLADGKVNVFFRLQEYAGTIAEVVYNGARHLKPDDLNTLTGLHKGAAMNPLANQAACQAIVRRYQEDGRLFANCDLLEGTQPNDTRVVFDITEGPVVKVGHITFAGNTFVSSARLATQINSGREWLRMFGGKFDPVLADLDVAKLEEYYKAFGFQAVHVSRELQWESDGRHVTLVFHVQEGPRYKVQDVHVVGVHQFSAEEVETVARLHRGDWYNEQQADADVRALKDYYGWAGYDAKVRKEVFFAGDGACQVRYQVQERPPARVGQVFVVGNEVTRQNVILRQVPLYPGQVLTYPDLRRAEQNLARLNIFENTADAHPTVSVIDPDSDTEFKDILVQVQEARTGSLMFGVGVNSDSGLTGSIVLNERNFDILRPPTSLDDLLEGRAFRGAGQEFRLEVVPGTEVQRYAATFREPSLFDSPYSLTASTYYYTRQYNEYNESRLGGSLSVGRKLNENWSVSGTVRLEDVGVHNIPAGAPEDFTSVQGDNFLAGFKASLIRDTRDSFLRPTSGSLLNLSYEQVTGDFNFPIAKAEFDKFWTVYQRPDGSGRQVLAFRSQVGWETSNAPVFERFYAGGSQSLRGYAFRGVGPNVDGFEVGGDFLFLNSLEYQVPLRANDQIYAVAFVDSGTVEPSLELKDYRVTAGFGLRFVVPMLGPVPIALDFGFPIVKGPHDHEQVFSFWLGFFH